jgi:site-specific DNA-methyltransferase (adenine-specific)
MNHFDLRLGDCRKLITQLGDNSIDLVVTDPPYFIDGMGDDWSATNLEDKAARAGVIGSLPRGDEV